jgi:hypothetical protein
MQFLNILLSFNATDPPDIASFPLNLQSIHRYIVEKMVNKIAPPTALLPPNIKVIAKFLIN